MNAKEMLYYIRVDFVSCHFVALGDFQGVAAMGRNFVVTQSTAPVILTEMPQNIHIHLQTSKKHDKVEALPSFLFG